MVEIFLLDASELMEMEALQRCYRSDIFVKIDQEYYKLTAMQLIRLEQDFKVEISYHGFYMNEANMILVENLSNKTIIDTILFLVRKKYFESIKNIEIEKVKSIAVENESELQKIY